MYKHKKKFGQHFLDDENILNKIVDSAYLREDDEVWEIGPGLGTLTDVLLSRKARLTIFEIDNDLIPNLKKKFDEKCKIIHSDVLRVNWADELGEKRINLVSNLPYQISSPVLYKISKHFKSFNCVVLMLQKEVAKRLCANPGKKDYGVLTLKTQFYFNTEYLFDVSRDSFTPPPDVESAVIRMTPRAEIKDLSDIDLFWNLVETAFRNRRKTLRNNLKYLNCDFNPNECPIDLNRRGETLSEEDFINLFDFLYKPVIL